MRDALQALAVIAVLAIVYHTLGSQWVQYIGIGIVIVIALMVFVKVLEGRRSKYKNNQEGDEDK
mgnify:CR=1 FL=1